MERTTQPTPQRICSRYKSCRGVENILLVGAVGAGKSATINTIVAALSGEWRYKAPVGSKYGESGRRTTTHLIWYNKCGISDKRVKEMRIPSAFPNLVDMTGLANENSPSQQKLLDMIVTGRIWDKTSISAIQDVQKTYGDGRLGRMYPFSYRGRRIHKILFIASATDPIPTELIKCIKCVAQPDGSASNLNPRYIPIFGLLTKTDMVNKDRVDIDKKEEEFLESLGIDATTSYSKWKNSTTGDYSMSDLLFLDRLLSPDVRYVLDKESIIGLAMGEFYEKPVQFTCVFTLVVAMCFALAQYQCLKPFGIL